MAKKKITDNEWQSLRVLTCNRCNLKTSDMALLQAHHCPPRNQQITAGVSYNLVNAKFTCSLCTVELSESEFCEHLEGHLTLKPYICKYCDRDFSTRDDVCDHLGFFHQQDEQIFVLKLTGRTKEIIKKARNIGKVFYKPVNVLVPMSNSAAVVISKTLHQNLTSAAGQKQTNMKAPVASCSHLSSLGPTSTVHSNLPTAISPAQPQTGSVPTPSTNALQTQAPSCLSQNVCPPASDTSWRHPFAQKFPGQIVVPVKNLPMFLQGINAQRGSIQRPATTLPNLVTHSLHSAAPCAAQNVNTRGVHIVTNVSTTSVNHVKNAPALTVAPVFHLNQACLSSPSVQTTSGNQMASTSIPNLMNNISPSSAVTSKTHKAGDHLVPTVSPSPMNQPIAPAVIASTEENSPLMSADMSVHCQRHTESDAGNIYKVSIQQFPTEIKSIVESYNVKGDFAGNGSLQINQEASSLATEIIHERSSAAVIKSEDSTVGDTDTPLQIRIENIMSLASCHGDFQQFVQDNVTEAIASTESSLTETGSTTTEHQFTTEWSSNLSFLHVIKGYFLCLVCHMIWLADYDSFFKHIWEKHIHGADFSCCPTGYSPYCARLEAIVKTIYDKSHEPMTDQIRSYFTPKSSIETEIENVQNIYSSESNSSAPEFSRVETVKQINVSERPSSIISVRPCNAPNECQQILPAESVSRNNESFSPPTTLVPDQHRHMIETEQNYEFGILTAGNELEKDVQESAVLLEVQSADTTDNQNTSFSCELRDDRYGNMRNIPDIDINCAEDSNSGNQQSCYTYIYEDTSDDDCDDNNGHNRGTGSINYSLVDSPYSDELALDLSKKTTQSEKSHNSVTVTPLLAAETAAVSSVAHMEKLSSERINNSHNNCTITLLPAAETAVTSSITQTAVTSSITQTAGLLPERVRMSHDNVTLTPLSATETVVNPRTMTERLKSSLAANSNIDAVNHFGCNMCQSEFENFDQLGLNLQESLLKAIECKYCASFFLNIVSWKEHMALEHVGLPRMYCIKRKRMCYECKMHSNVPQQSSQEDIPCLSNVERDAETSDYQCEGTHHESHATSGATENVLDEIETEASHVIENYEVRSKDVELTETHSHHEGRDMADGIEAQTTHDHISKLPNLLDLVKTSTTMTSLTSDVSLNDGKSEQGAGAMTEPNSNERNGNSVAQQCESGTYTTTISERRRGNSVAQQCESGTYTTTINERRRGNSVAQQCESGTYTTTINERRRGNSVAQQCESGTYTTTINERRRGNSVAQQCESGTYTTTINERRRGNSVAQQCESGTYTTTINERRRGNSVAQQCESGTYTTTINERRRGNSVAQQCESGTYTTTINERRRGNSVAQQCESGTYTTTINERRRGNSVAQQCESGTYTTTINERRRGNSVAQQCESGTYTTTINERRRGNSVAQQCESGTYTTTINERRGSVDIDLHGLMRPVSSRGNNELRETAPDLTAIKTSICGNDELMQIENSGNMEEYVQPVSKTSTSIDSSKSVKSALSHAEDNLTNTILDYEDLCHQEVVAKITLGVQSSSHDNCGQTVSENINTLPYNMTVPLNDHCLNGKAEFSVVGQTEAVSEISQSRVKHTSLSVVGNIDASSVLDQATSVESQDGCDVTSVSSSDTVIGQASDCSVGSKDYFNIIPTTLSLPVTRVSDLASTSAANFNLDLAEISTILCVSEQNKLEYTMGTCLPVEDIGADIDNRQESRHSSVVLENNLRSGVQHDIEHEISNVVKDGGDQAASAAVNGNCISQTVFLSSHTSTVGENSIQEHQQTDVLPSCNIRHSDEAARTDSFVSVISITAESILSLQLENRQKPTEHSVVQQTVKGASVINRNVERARDSETNINNLLKDQCTNNRSPCTPDVSSVLKTVSHDSDDIANPATNSLGPDQDSCHDADFSSSKDPACTLQETVGDFAGNDILESDISYGHDLLHLNIDKTSSNLTQDIQAEKQETKKYGSYDKIHHNKNSLVSTKDGQLYASNETSACIESRETPEVKVLNSPSQNDTFMEENYNIASVDQISIASNITENKDSSHTETNGLSDMVSTEQDLSNSHFRCNCATLISCFTDGDHNVQPQDKSLNISFTGKCAGCRLVTEESSHPDNTTEQVTSKTVDAVPSNEKKIDNYLRELNRTISENHDKIGRLEHICGNHINRSKVDPPENRTIKPDVMSSHTETCVGPEISKTNPALKYDLETAADNGSIVLSESKNTARDSTTSNREMLGAHCKRKSEAGNGEGIITSKLLIINSKKHHKPEDTIKKLDRAVAVSQSPKDIQSADVAIPDSARFRCSACPFVTSRSYTELKQHVKSRHPQDKSARVCRIRSRSLQNEADQSERWQDATLSLQEDQNNDMNMSCVHDGITTPQHTGIHSETSIEYRATVNKSEIHSESSHNIHKERDIRIYRCIRPKCTFTSKWNLKKMKAHIKSKHPYYSCGYCKAPYTPRACLYKHLTFLHRSKKPRVIGDTIALDLLFRCVDISYNRQGAECTDVTLQTPAKQKKRSQSSVIDDVKKSEAKANSELKVLKMKSHNPLKICDVNVTSNKQNQPLGDSKTERTSKDNDDNHPTTAQGLKTPQCRLTRSKSKSILQQISKDISPVPEHEVSSAEKPTVTSKTAAISNNDDSLSAKTERNIFKNAMSSTFAKSVDHTPRIPHTGSLYLKKTVEPNAALLLSPRSTENNTRRHKVTKHPKSGRHSSAQNVCSKMRPLGPVSFQDTVRKENSSAATSNHIDINVSLNSASSVQSLGTVKKQELSSADISDKQESSNRLGNVHETLPEICSETASCVSDTVLLRHTTTVASAVVTLKTQDKKRCGTWATGQLEVKTAAKGNVNRNLVPEDMRTHSNNNLGLQNESKTESKFENAPTTGMMLFTQRDYPFRCTACSRILKCVRDIEKHYNRDHPRQDVRLTERKSGFVYSISGKCLRWTDEFKATRDSYLCSNCAFRSMARSDVEAHLKHVHPTHKVRVFTLRKPNKDSLCTRSKVTALPHEASSSNSPTSSYFCNVCSDVKYSKFQFRLHLASHPCYKHTTQLTAGTYFLCHTCGYIAKSSGDFVQHTGEHLSEKRFTCFMCEHDSHHKGSVRVHIKNVHNKTVDDDVGIIDREKQRNVHLRPRIVNIDPQVVLIDPFRQPNYLQQLLLAYGIKRCPDILRSEQDVNGKYVAIK